MTMESIDNILKLLEKKANYKQIFLVLFLFFNATLMFSQQGFQHRENTTVRGDVLMAGNAILGLTNNPPNSAYNIMGTSNGGTNRNTAYIDIDGDNTTFSSSSADLVDPNVGCTSIVSAGLYWSANYYLARQNFPNNYSNTNISSGTNTRTVLTINNTTIAGVYNVRNDEFSSDNSDIRLRPASSNLVVAQPTSGCGITNGAALAGNIAVVQTGGGCSDRNKVLNAQAAGAIGVVIVSSSGNLHRLLGGGSQITIPSVTIGNDDITGGGNLITQLQAQTNVVNATLSTTGNEDTTNLSATDVRKLGTADFQNIRLGFGPPGSVTYSTVQPQVGTLPITLSSGTVVNTHPGVIYDGYSNTVSNNNANATDNVPYVCYADVTSIVQNNGYGTYTVADMKATLGVTSGVSGAAGGWTLVVVYQDPSPASVNRFISVYDGFREIQSGAAPVNLPITGFTTLPAPNPVNVRLGSASLEGDNGIQGDNLLIQNAGGTFVPIVDAVNPNGNFFNSSISVDGAYTTNRNPASRNTLGFDSDIFDLANNSNSIIPNGATNANFRLFTAGDTYQSFLLAFSVENIIPELRILKEVYNPSDLSTPINNSSVGLGDQLVYRLRVENIGNEDYLGNVIIDDELPANVDLLSVDGINVSTNPSGNLTSIPSISYTTSGIGTGGVQTIQFSIPPNLLTHSEPGAPGTGELTIDFIVQLVATCDDLRDACSDRITNVARGTYRGILSNTLVTDDPSSSALLACGSTDGLATNFLANVGACSQDVSFCGGDLILVAGDGYDEYVWSGPGGFSTTTTINTVTVPGAVSGTYSVIKRDTTPDSLGNVCMTLTEEFVVTDFTIIAHPLQDDAATENFITYYDVSSGGCNVPLAKINLCGNQQYTVDSGFAPDNIVNITWQELTNNSCLDRGDNCPAITGGCDALANWTTIATPPKTTSYGFTDPGEYRIIVEFEGGCTQVFYFDINKNNYQPQVDVVDMECNNDGSVQVNNFTAGGTLRFLIRDQTAVAPTLPGDLGLFTNTDGLFPIAFQVNPYLFTVYAVDTAFPNCIYEIDGTVRAFQPVFDVDAFHPECVDNTNGNDLGSINIEVTGGAPQYEYHITGGPDNIDIVTGNSELNNGDHLFTGLKPGNYTIEVVSNRNPDPECLHSEVVTINDAPDFTAVARIIAPPTCDTGAIVEVIVTSHGQPGATTGPYQFAEQGGVFQSPASGDPIDRFEFTLPTTATAADEFIFEVSDTSTRLGCTIEARVNGPEPYVPIAIQTITVTDPVCPTDLGRIQVELTPASAVTGRTFIYELLDSTGTVVQTITSTSIDRTFPSVAVATGYTVRVSHNNTTDPSGSPICPVEMGTYDIDGATAVAFDAALTRFLSCNTGIDAEAQITIDNFQGGVSGTYEWATNPAGPFTTLVGTSLVINATGVTTATSYTIYVRDPSAPDCAVPQSVAIPALLDLDNVVLANERDSDCANQTFVGDISASPALSAADVGNAVQIAFTVTPAPASGPATFNITTTAGIQTLTFDRNVNYTITAVRSDNQCDAELSFNRPLLPEIDITSATETSAVTCFNGTDGAFTFNVANSSSFNYRITGPSPATTVVATGTSVTSSVTIESPATPLAVGTYTITVEDTSLTSNNCTDTTTVDITGPPTELTISATATPTDCGANTGTITATGNGGRGSHQYRLVDSASTIVIDYPNTDNEFNGLAAGTYTIFVRDGNSSDACEISTTAEVIQSTSPTIAAVAGGDACVDSDPASQWITITPSPTTTAVGPFEYTLTGPVTANDVPVTFLSTTPPVSAPANTFEIDNLIAGNYSITVTNTETNCVSGVENFTINPELTITATLAKDIDCNSGASITFTASGGSTVYTQYDLYNPPVPPATTPTLVQANITSPHATSTPGDYLIGVTDDAGCTAFSNTVTVTPFDAVVATLTPTNPSCPGLTNPDGTIQVEVTVGQGPFTYVLDGDLTTQIGPTGDTTVTFNNVGDTPNPHTITITDGSGGTPACTFNFTTTLTDPNPIVPTINIERDLSCVAPTDAIIRISGVIGGSGSWAYTLDPSAGYTNITTFPVDIPISTDATYTVHVANQGSPETCSVATNVTIEAVTEITDLSFAATPVQCTAITSNVTVTPTIVGSGSVIEYEITSPAPVGPQASNLFNNLAPGTYRFLARTDDGCVFSENFIIEDIDQIGVSATPVNEPTCNGGFDGELSFTVSGIDIPATATYEYEITGGTPAIIPITATNQTAVTIPTGDILPAGNYTIRVTDEATLCEVSTTVTIGQPDVVNFDIDTVVQDCVTNTNTVTISNPRGGSGTGYTYTLSNSGGTLVGPSRPASDPYLNVPNGTGYQLVVTDSNSCISATQTLDINQLPQLTATLDAASSDFCLDDGAINFTVDIDAVNAGTSPYTYNVTLGGVVVIPDTNVPGPSFTTSPNLTAPGDYIITIFDTNGCPTSITVPTVEEPVQLQVTPVSDITCDALGNPVNATFSLAIPASNPGYAPYTIDVSFDGGAFANHLTAATPPFTNYTATSGAGTYTFRVTDARGCTFTTLPFNVTDPVAPTVTDPDVNLDCSGDTGTVVITVTGTETPYEIDFNGAGFVTITGTQITFPNLAGDAGDADPTTNTSTYNYTVRSSKGCLYPGSVNVNQPALIEEVSRVETPVTCGGSGTVTDLGAIDLEIAGGTANYTYTLVTAANFSVRPLVPATTAVTTPNPTTTGTTVRFEGLDFGQYFIFVTDANGCTDNAPFGPFNIFSPPNDLVQNITVSATCPGGVTFEIDVQGGSGVTPPTNPPPGFDIRIVGEPSPGLGDFVPLDDSVGGATVVDANTPIRDHTYTGLSFNRTYTLEVRDNATGCLYQEMVPAQNPPSSPIIINDVVTNVSCNETPALDDGSVTFDVSAYGATVTEISWEVFNAFTNVSLGAAFTGSDNSTPGPAIPNVPVTINNLPPGEYYVAIQEVDGTQCPTRYDFSIDLPEPLTSIATNQTPANSCGTNAQVIMNTNGGTPFATPPADGYRYEVVPTGAGDPGVYPLTSNVIDLGNTVQTLDIWAADSNGCSFGPITVTTVVNPLPTVTASFIDDCAYDNTNVIDIDGTGLGTLTYQLGAGTPVAGSIDNNNHQFIVSAPGTYTITITDESGCTNTDTVTVYIPLQISPEFTTAPDCNTANGVIDATTIVSGAAQGTLTYELQDSTGTATGNTTGDASGIYTGVAPGSYIVEVTDDGRGTTPFCSFTAPVSIEAPEEPVLVPETTFVSCIGNTDGVVTAALTPASTDSDPTVVYEYRITASTSATPAVVPTPYQTDPVFSSLDNGTYTVEVRATKPNGSLNVFCFDTEDYIINDPTAVSATISSTNYSCPAGTENVPVITIDNISGGTGSTYTISYTVDGTPVVASPVDPTTLDTDPAAGIQIVAVIPGDYIFTIYDSNNCPTVQPTETIPVFPEITDPTVVRDTSATNNGEISCDNGETVTVTITGGVGPFNFVETSGAVPAQNGIVAGTGDTAAPGVQTVATFVLPSVGTYQFTITDTDANGACPVDSPTYRVDPFDSIEASAVEATPVNCNGASTGELDLTVLNYTGDFDFRVVNTTTAAVVTSGSITAPFTNPVRIGLPANGVPAGTYVVEVEALAAPFCDTTTDPFTITQPELLTLAIDENINANCNEDARVTVSVTGGTGPYTYRADDDGIAPFLFETTTANTTETFLLPATIAGTTYIISAIDTNSCTSTPVSINETVFRTGDPTVDSVTWTDSCVFDDSYTIRVVGTSNVPVIAPATNALTFEIGAVGSGQVAGNVNGTTHDFTVTTPGTYTVRVYDENGCVSTDETITIVPELTISATFTGTPECRTSVNGQITATVTGGSDFVANPGNFIFTLTGTDSSGTPIAPIVQTGAGGNIFNSVTAGSYTVIVTDSNVLPATGSGCSANDSVSLPIPVLPSITAVGEAVSCIGDSDGRVVITLDPTTDDGQQYTYQLFVDAGGGVPGAQVGTDQIDNPVFTNVPVGNYVTVIRSSSLCEEQATANVPNATQVTASANVGNYTCTGTNENFPTVTVTIQDGTPAYSITYTTPSGVVVTDTNITDADAVAVGVQYEFTADENGTYDINVTDSKGCALVAIVQAIIDLPIMEDPTVTQDTAITCLVDEEVTVSVTDGAGPFNFEVVSGPVAVAPQNNVPAGTADNPGTPAIETNATNTTFTLTDVGLYIFRITDQTTGCFVEVDYRIDAFDNIEVRAEEESRETCFGADDGRGELFILGYAGAFDYTIVDASGSTVYDSAVAGTTENTDLDVNTEDNFVIPRATEPGLGIGNYTVNITQNGIPNCTGTANFTISGPTNNFNIVLDPGNLDETCSPGSDGSFLASVTGAQGTVTYTLALPATPATIIETNTDGVFEGYAANTYLVTAIDDMGTFTCSDSDTIIIDAPANDVAITAIPDSSVSCYGAQDGIITVTANGSDGPFEYTLTPAGETEGARQDSNQFTLLAPGTYTVTVYDSLNCSNTTPAVINEPAEVTVNFSATLVDCTGNPNPTVDVTVTGTSSVAITEYVVLNIADPLSPVELQRNGTGTFTLPVGDYQFYVIDANGCQSQPSGALPVIAIPDVEITLDTRFAFVNCNGAANGIINANVTGGTGAYTYTLSAVGNVLTDGTAFTPIIQSNSEFRNLAPANYIYTVNTDRSCSDSESFTIIDPPLFEPVFSSENVTCEGLDNGLIRIEAIGGTPPYSFAIDNGEFLNDGSDGAEDGVFVFDELAPGMYNVIAQDALGCNEIRDIEILEPNPLMVSPDGDPTPETCFGDSDGQVTIIITGGTAPYETNITNNDADFVQDMFTYTGLPGGITTIYVRDANNCRIDLPVNIPAGVMLNATLVPRLECPVRDENDPSVIIQGPRYFVDFETFENSIDTDIIYTLTGVNGTVNPAQNVNLEGRFEVNPGEYEGTMEHSGGCIVDVGRIVIEEYIPLAIPVAEMTNNPEDPNEYEIVASGGRRFENNPFYSFSFTILPDGMTVNQLQSSDFTELQGNIFVIRETADYVLRVIDADGCEIRIVQNLTYINIRIPNYFTPDSPNSSTEERLWYPRQITPNTDDPFFFENMEVMVFDRYGRKLAEFKGDQQGWDGLYQGKQLPSGDYWYTIILNDIDNREFTGHFTLYR